MENIKNIISKHNSSIIKGAQSAPPPCECEDVCPVDGECQQTGIVYQATIHLPNNKVEKYIGLTERKFEDRFKEHTRSFEVRKAKNSTTLSKKIWKLKEQRLPLEISWKILKKAKPYQSGDTHCQLCLTEIYMIMYKPEEASLNSRTEFFNKCRHSNKFKLDKSKL